jgi:hypothetical protein
MSLLFLFFITFTVFPILGVEKETRNLDEFFGINGIDFFAGRESPEIRRTLRLWLDDCRELGITRQRIRFNLGTIKPEKGRFSWDFSDLLVREFKRKDQKILPVVYRDFPMVPFKSFSTMEYSGYYPDVISLLMRRYSKDIRSWEVFDKPPFSPNPDHYVGYLRSTYLEAGMTDSKPQVVASFPDPYDLSFWESFYKRYDKDFRDVLSFPYYPQVLHEDDLRRALIDIQYLKMRFGDAEKRIWISEMGISSNSNISDNPPPSPERSAEWMVKAHITALATGIVDCIFWSRLVDQISETNENSGRYGLVYQDISPKPAFFAYRTMTRLLKDMNYVGPLSIHPDVKAFLFQKGGKKGMICWAEKGEYPLTLASNKNLTLVNLYGNEKRLDPAQGAIRVSLSNQPIYLTDITNQTDVFSSLKCSPDVVYTYPGESKELTITLENPGHPMTGSILVSAPSGLILPEHYWKIQGTDKNGFRKTFRIIVSPEAQPGFYSLAVDCEMDDPSLKSLSCSATIRVIDPVRIDLRGQQEALRFKMETRIENVSLNPLKGSLNWELKPRGKVQTLPQNFTLASNDVITTQSSLIAGNKEARLIASVKLNNGYSRQEGIGLMSIPLRLAAPRVDGYLKEWIDVPELYLDGVSQSTRNKVTDAKENNDIYGVFQFWLTESDFYIGALINDDIPLINPFPDDKMNQGDGVELFLGLGGPGVSFVYGNKDFHIGIAPGHQGRMPRLWNWTLQAPISGGEVVSCKTQDGYLLEAKIPFASLGAWTPQRDLMIGFDVALNDLDEEKSNKPPHTLIWNGNHDNLSNPSKWGLAIIW